VLQNTRHVGGGKKKGTTSWEARYFTRESADSSGEPNAEKGMIGNHEGRGRGGCHEKYELQKRGRGRGKTYKKKSLDSDQ